MGKKTTLSVVGINHKTATIEQREKFECGRKEIPDCLKTLFSYPEVEGAVMVTTCNRLEFYLTHNADADPFKIIRKFYSNFRASEVEDNREIFQVLHGKEVTRHLFRVVSGLESMVVGEYQILGQVKEAYSIACQQETVDKILHKLMHAAFRAGKKTRSDTSMGACKQSVSGVASQILIKNLEKESKIAIIGVNENSKIITLALQQSGFSNFVFVNRTYYKAEMMAHNYGGKAMNFEDLEECLASSDAVYTSTGAQHYIASNEMMHRLYKNGKCPKLIIDMAVPRDIDTQNLPEYIIRYDISKLKDYLDKEREFALVDLPKAEEVIENEVQVFQAWSDTQNNQYLNPYAEKFELIRQQLIEENKHAFPQQTLEEVDRMTRSLIHRLQPTIIRALVNTEKNANGTSKSNGNGNPQNGTCKKKKKTAK